MLKRTVTKTLTLAGLLATTISSTQANHTGFYVGAAVGGAAMTGKSTLFLNRNNPPQLNQEFNRTIGAKNIAGDIFVAYGQRFKCVWTAIEAVAALTSLNSQETLALTNPDLPPQTLSTKTSNAWGATLNIGGFINATNKLYLKLGIEIRRFRVNFPWAGYKPSPLGGIALAEKFAV